MALSGKLEVVFDLKSTPEQFYGVWRKEPHQVPKHTPKPHQVPKHTPKNIKDVTPHEHDWDSHDHGCKKTWNYYLQGKEEVFHEKVEFDDENKIVTLVGLDGHVMELYKIYKGTWYVTPKGSGSVVRCVMEYEGRDETIPPPYNYFDFMISLTKDIDEGIVSKN